MAVTLLSTTDGGRLYSVTSSKSAVAKKHVESTLEEKSQPASYIRSDANILAGLSRDNPFAKSGSSTIYDKPDHKASVAISTYKDLANMQRREEIQHLVGVDVYA